LDKVKIVLTTKEARMLEKILLSLCTEDDIDFEIISDITDKVSKSFK
jgi:hypothetical protein